MRKRIAIVAVGAILCAGGLAVAQNPPLVSAEKGIIRQGSDHFTLSGGASLTVNGVVVRADRMVVAGREVTLEGNVRMTLPAPK
jgi:hypothetical protein